MHTFLHAYYDSHLSKMQEKNIISEKKHAEFVLMNAVNQIFYNLAGHNQPHH